MKQVILLQLLTSLAVGTPVVQRQDAGVDATALGQSWIDKIEDFVNADKNVDAETKNALINNMSKCSLEPLPIDLYQPDRYKPYCPTVFSGINNGDAVDAANLGQAWITKAGTAMRGNESLQARQQILGSILNCTLNRYAGQLPGDPDAFRTFCYPVEGDEPSSSTGIAPVTQGEEEKPDGEDFANADECLNSRVDPDGMTFSYN